MTASEPYERNGRVIIPDPYVSEFTDPDSPAWRQRYGMEPYPVCEGTGLTGKPAQSSEGTTP